MNSRRTRQTGYFFGLGLILFFIRLPVCAQDPGSSGSPPSRQGTGAQSSDKDQKTPDNSNPAPPIAPAQVLDATPVVREVGRADQLGQSTSPLRWGPLYVASAEALMAYDNLSGSGSTLSSSGMIGILKTTVVFDKHTEQNRFAIQYSPSVAFASGQVYSNLTSQSVSFDSAKNLTPRLNISFNDSFSVIRTTNLLVDNYFSVDTIGNTTLQGQFLNNAGRSIRDSSQLSVGYMLSPQTRLSVSGSYDYADTTDFRTPSVASEYGTGINLTRIFSHADTVGATYGFQLAHIFGQGDLYFHNFGLTYTRLLTESLSIGGTGSASVVVPARGLQGSERWTWAGSAQVVKSFNSSSLGLAYARTQGITQVITTQFYDRVDGSYNSKWSPRLNVSVGGGYFRTVSNSSALQQHYIAKYVRASTVYLLTPSLGVTVTFTRQLQTGDASQVLTGTNTLIFAGLRWVPGVAR
jgi:hypothetical protein